MKRPIACTAFVLAVVLCILQIWDMSIFGQSPVISCADGTKSVCGFLQEDQIKICGTIKDYSYNQYERITTELILKDVQILPLNEGYSKDNPQNKSITYIGQTILVYLDGEMAVGIGNRVILTGKLSFFQEASNPGEFDAARYYRNKDVLFALKKGRLIQISKEKNTFLQALKEFRLQQELFLGESLPLQNAAVMKAMLFGNKKEIEEEIKNLYHNNGIAHILAISGLHISLLGMSVYRGLQRLPLPRIFVFVGSSFFLLIYGLMVGFPASAFRAIVMFAFFLLGKILKRSYDMLTALAVSFTIQIFFHPGYIFDCGFQLSYSAILGIGILQPALEARVLEIKHTCIKKILKQILPSLSVSLVTTPILIYHYYELSLFSIVLNMIVLPLMKPLLLSGIGLLGMVNIMAEFPARILAAVVNFILWIYEMSCRILEIFPIGRRNMEPLSPGAMFMYYMFLIALTVSVKQKNHLYQFVIAIILMCFLFIPRSPDFSVWMLDVGQGDCNVIFTRKGNCYIIDCGSTSKYNVGKKILIPFLKYHGIGRITGVIVTHPDADHMNGVVELLENGTEENIMIEAIYIYDKGLQNEGEEWKTVTDIAKESEIPVYGIGQGDVLKEKDGVTLECIYPLDEQENLTGNAASLVMKVEYGEFCGIFTGDLEADGEKLLVEKMKQSAVDVLKVGHHGSSGSSCTDFLQWLNPTYAVISCGRDNSYGHPHKETLERLKAVNSRVLITYEEGAICFEK